jgi:hypothetical protein
MFYKLMQLIVKVIFMLMEISEETQSSMPKENTSLHTSDFLIIEL